MQSWPVPDVPAVIDTPARSAVVSVWDSTSQRLQPAAAAGARRFGLYVCGITPYDATHLGHAATYIAFDLLVRRLHDAGLEVTLASNVTDVDDPLLERAAQRGVDWRALAVEQEELFRSDMTALGVIPPDFYRGAVETIDDVAGAVADLLARGLAYRVDLDLEAEPGAGGDSPEQGDVYADLALDPSFGSVSNASRAEMLELFAERGGDPQRPGKRNQLDPLLWRRERPGEPSWDGGVLGTGRPGWHIECAVIARDGLGASFDVLGGGSDLLFPHHEMSASHARELRTTAAEHEPAARGARLHVHAGLVAYQGAKMSKSLGNLVFVSALRREGVAPAAIRLALLAHHYRADWEWFPEELDKAQRRLDQWRAAVAAPTAPAAAPVIDGIRRALNNDLDAPAALTVVDAWATAARAGQPGGDGGAPAQVAAAVGALLGVALD